MGVFSFKCALTGLEIANNMIGMPDWMTRMVLLRKDREPVRGNYDGYGRLWTDDGELDEFYEDGGYSDPTVILERAYNGEQFDTTPPNTEHADYQGHFFPPEYEAMAERKMREYLGKVEKHDRTWTVTVEYVGADDYEDIDEDDHLCEDSYEYECSSEEEALCRFHDDHPCGDPSLYSITATPCEAEALT